jgi:hypothetical protein
VLGNAARHAKDYWGIYVNIAYRIALIAAGLLALPWAAYADPVTYDFTGTVTAKSGVFSSAGTTVSGTLTIDFAAANAAQSIGTLGSTSAFWEETAYGGSVYAAPSPAALVFGFTLVSGGVSYGASSPASAGSDSWVENQQNTGSLLGWTADDTEFSAASDYLENVVTLIGGAAGSAPYGANGLPLLANAASQQDQLIAGANGAQTGQLQYTISTLTPVPLPSSTGFLLLGLGGLAALGRKRPGVPRATPSLLRS